MPLWPRQDQPAIITPNHTSYLDGPLLALLTPRPLLFGVDPDFSTREPWRSLLLGIGRIRGCQMVTMTPGRGQGLRQMLRTLHRGGWVCLFPEGGIETGQEYPGARWLAERTGARIHPLEIHALGVGKMKMPYNIFFKHKCLGGANASVSDFRAASGGRAEDYREKSRKESPGFWIRSKGNRQGR